nr:MAG TPA_asm: hypothetical protein [Caudoviricetes sp.]
MLRLSKVRQMIFLRKEIPKWKMCKLIYYYYNIVVVAT